MTTRQKQILEYPIQGKLLCLHIYIYTYNVPFLKYFDISLDQRHHHENDIYIYILFLQVHLAIKKVQIGFIL